jgi:hypothetical protein
MTANDLFRYSRRRPPRQPFKVEAPAAGRHRHVFAADGFCTVCQEHSGYLEATPAEPITPGQLLSEPAHAAAPTDDEWVGPLADADPPDGARGDRP